MTKNTSGEVGHRKEGTSFYDLKAAGEGRGSNRNTEKAERQSQPGVRGQVDLTVSRHCKAWGRESVRKNKKMIKTTGLTEAGNHKYDTETTTTILCFSLAVMKFQSRSERNGQLVYPQAWGLVRPVCQVTPSAICI